MKFFAWTAAWVILTSLQPVWADEIPPCPGYSGDGTDAPNLPINDSEVLHWKRTTPNQFTERAHVEGDITDLVPDRNGHLHFIIQIGPNSEDTIEIIYNEVFGQTPTPTIGMHVEACGDYITATDQSGPYPPSPTGAILHWVHLNPRGTHPSGFLVIDGTLCGQDISHAGSKRPYNAHYSER